MPNINQIADKAIKNICAEIIATNGIISIQGFKDDILRDEENLLIAELNKDKEFNFQKLQERARYFYPKRGSISPLAFTSTYGELKNENNESYERFKELLKADLNEIKNQKIKKFDLYFPINIKTNKKISKFKLNDIEIDFLESNKIKFDLDNNKLKKEFIINRNFKLSKQQFCKISLKGRNSIYAVRRTEGIYDFILGVIGFYETYRSNPYTIIGIPKPISKLNQTYIFVIQNKKYLTHYHYKTKDEKTSIIDLNEEKVKAINFSIKRIIKAKQQELIFKLFIAYFRGLVDKNVDYSFLSFWRVIENGILKEPSQKHREIIEIFKALIIELNYKTKFKLDRFYNLRNDFVHEGIADIDQFDRNGIKRFAKLLINTYLTTLYNYQTDDIKLFFYYVKRKENIKVHVKMAKRIDSLLKKVKDDIKNGKAKNN